MMPNAIDSLAQAVPGIRQERPLPDNWAGDFEVVADKSELADEIEDGMAGSSDSTVRCREPIPRMCSRRALGTSWR
jgi:hypothetical protein